MTSPQGTGGLRLDIVAGLTAAAVVLPKAMAYAIVAGLPVAVEPASRYSPPPQRHIEVKDTPDP